MANYYGSCRTNYFRVKDEEAFKAWVEELPGVVAVEEGGRFALLEEYGEGWHEAGEKYDYDVDVIDDVIPHLAPGEVAVFQEVGAEKLRYLVGYSVAVNDKGEKLWVDIEDIYKKVEAAGWGTPTRVAY